MNSLLCRGLVCNMCLWYFLIILTYFFACCSMFCCVHSSFSIILMGKRKLVALPSLSSWCLLIVVWLFFASLYVEADEPSFTTQRENIFLQYAIRLAENPSNPAHEVTFPPKYTDLYEIKPNCIKSFGVRILPLLKSANINPKI